MDPPPPLDLPNQRKFFGRWKITIVNCLLHYFVKILSLPLRLWPLRNGFTTQVHTGKTGKCRVCIYTPNNDAGLKKKGAVCRGVLVHLHGGSWTIGRPETDISLCEFFCQKLGIIVIAPGYRKAPKYPYPHALEQCYYLLSWIATGGLSEVLRHHRFMMDINPKLIMLSGRSSGANLAASLTLLCMNRPLPNSAAVVGTCLLYPSLNMAIPYAEKVARVYPNSAHRGWMAKIRSISSPPVLRARIAKFHLDGYLPPPRSVKDPYVSPALAPRDILAKFPPTIIITAAQDYLAHEADEFASTLRDLDIQMVHKRFLHVGHGFDVLPTWDKKQRELNDEAREKAWAMMVTILGSILKKKAGEGVF